MATTDNTNQLTREEVEFAIEARRAYQREYRRKFYAQHPERQRLYNLRYWLRRAQREAEGKGGADCGGN